MDPVWPSARPGSVALAAVIQAAGYLAQADGHKVRVEVADYKREVPRLLSTLLGAGIQVYGAQVQEPSLEEIFLKMLGEKA